MIGLREPEQVLRLDEEQEDSFRHGSRTRRARSPPGPGWDDYPSAGMKIGAYLIRNRGRLGPVHFLKPPDERADIDAVDGPFQVAPVDHAENDDLLAVRPEEGPKVSGLDLPELLTPEFLHFAGRPGRRFE